MCVSAQSCYQDYCVRRYHFIKKTHRHSHKRTHALTPTHTHSHPLTPTHTHPHTQGGWTKMAWGLVIRSIAQGNCVNGLLWMSWCDGKRVWINKEPIKRWQSATVCSQSFIPRACAQLYNTSVKGARTISLLKMGDVEVENSHFSPNFFCFQSSCFLVFTSAKLYSLRSCCLFQVEGTLNIFPKFCIYWIKTFFAFLMISWITVKSAVLSMKRGSYYSISVLIIPSLCCVFYTTSCNLKYWSLDFY